MNSDIMYDILKDVAKASGHAKRNLISVDMAPIFYHAYEPYRQYFIKKLHVEGEGTMQLSERTFNLLDDLTTRKLTGHAAEQAVYNHGISLTPKSCDLFMRILKKDLRCGIGRKTVNKIFPGLVSTHDVMLAKLYDASKVKFPCWSSAKIDGIRAIFRQSTRRFYTRNGHIISGIDHLIDVIPSTDFDLDGELIVPNMSFQESSGLLRSDRQVPEAQYFVFEAHDKIPFAERLALIRHMTLGRPGLVPVAHVQCDSSDHIMQHYHLCRDLDYEGTVVKPFDYKYKGSRSWDWMKLKAVESLEARIEDFFEGTGKYADNLGGVIIKFKNSLVRVGSGFSDGERKVIWDNRDHFSGKTIEVAYQEVTPTGSLRHPRFIRMRPDKE